MEKMTKGFVTDLDRFKAVVIGGSAGAIEALGEILPCFPKNYPLPVIIVLHLPGDQPSLLVEIFRHKTYLRVKDAEDKESIQPGTIYFATPGYHLLIENDRTFSLSKEEPVQFSRPSIDVLFESAADAYGPQLVGVLLTGANQDGANGLKHIQESDGLALIQNPDTAQVRDMPEAACLLISATEEQVLSLADIGRRLAGLKGGGDHPLSSFPIQKESFFKRSQNHEFVKILLVDNLKDNLLALDGLVRRQDVEVFQAKSGTEALEFMTSHEFALALIDVQMPEMSGFELAELMRGTKATKSIPIIFVTATAKDQSFSFKGYERGAVDFLLKPLDPHAVKSKVNIFIDLYRQKKEFKNQLETITRIQINQAELLVNLLQTQTELQKAVQMRDEFMSIASHELKTPLTSLMLQVQLRKRNLQKGDPNLFTMDRLAKMYANDEKQLERITHLIDDMLDISRISSGKLSMNVESFDLCELVRDLVERSSEQFEGAGCRVTVETCQSAIGSWDRFRIEQVVMNLLTNAMRYGDKKPIFVQVNASPTGAQIIVQDQGRGIAKENHDRIFQRFERAAMGNEISGLGLGLYIVKQILEAHKSSIRVESQLGRGAKFVVDLPNYKHNHEVRHEL